MHYTLHSAAFPAPGLFVGSLSSQHSMDTFSTQTPQTIGASFHQVYCTLAKADAVQCHLPTGGQLDLSCFGTFDRLFAPQISSPLMSDAFLSQVPYGLTVEDNLFSGGSREALASHSMSFSPVDSVDTIASHRRNSSTASSVGYFVPGNPFDHLNRSEVSPLHQDTTSGSISGPRLILPSSPSGLSPAQLVDCLRHSPYVMEHCLEPTDHHRRSIFLELLRKTPNRQHHFECIVPRSDGTPCAKSFSRADRGLTHIRTHFDHRPFFCRGRCGNQNW
jgi:hypothetical protein